MLSHEGQGLQGVRDQQRSLVGGRQVIAIEPGLMSLNGTGRLTGSVYLTVHTLPMPPSPILSCSLWRPATMTPGAAVGEYGVDVVSDGGLASQPAGRP